MRLLSLLTLPLLAAFVLLAISCGSDESAPAEPQPVPVSAEAVEYSCPMHPEIRSDTEGSCPTCNMPLVKAAEADKDNTEATPAPASEGDGHDHSAH